MPTAFNQSHNFDARGREIAPTAKIAADACYVCGSLVIVGVPLLYWSSK